jgi:hypothetical protein
MANSLNYLFDPPVLSIANFFDQFPDRLFFITLTVLNLILFMLMFIGVATRWTSLLFSITCLLGHNFWYSFGKIDHLLLWYIAPAFLGFAGWGKYFSCSVFKKDSGYTVFSQKTNSMLILIFALSIGFSMFTSAAEKIGGGWLSWEGEGVRFNFIKNFLIHHRENLLTSPLIGFKNHLFWKLMDYSAIVFEFGFLFSTVRLSILRFFIAVAIVFHVLVLLMFNIPFYSNVIVYLIFIDWKLLVRKWNIEVVFYSLKRERNVVSGIILIAACFLCSWLMYFYNSRYFFNFPSLCEFILTKLSVSDPFGLSLGVFFLMALLLTVYLTYCHLTTCLKKGWQETESE